MTLILILIVLVVCVAIYILNAYAEWKRSTTPEALAKEEKKSKEELEQWIEYKRWLRVNDPQEYEDRFGESYGE